MPLARITIPLPAPIVGPDGPIKQVIIREPTYGEYLNLGDPYVIASSGDDDVPFSAENGEVIKAYLQLCMVEPKDPAILEAQLGARTAREIKYKMLSFFQPAAPAKANSAAAPATSQTNLPSETSGSAPPTSAS